MNFARGTSYQWGVTKAKMHLHAVLTHPDTDGIVAIVSFESWFIGKDKCCLLKAGQHRFFKHDTVPGYRYARTISLTKLESLKSQDAFAFDRTMNADLLNYVAASVARHRETSLDVRTYLNKALAT